MRSRKEELRKRRERDAKCRKRFARADETFCAEHHSSIFDDTKATEAQVLGRQLLRSGTSVGANYREAYRGRSKAEFISKCGDSLRELEETAYWLELLVDGKIVSPEKLAALRHECDELLAIFVTIIKRSKDNS